MYDVSYMGPVKTQHKKLYQGKLKENLMQKKQTVVFIISSGHSGSTLLDLILGTLQGVQSTGELIWLPWQVWRDGKICTATPKQDICTCLQTFKNCSVWKPVLERLHETTGINLFHSPLDYNITFLRPCRYPDAVSVGKKIAKRIMRHAIVHDWDWATKRVIKSQKEAIENSLVLYQAIFDTSGNDIIIDSSKDIFRAYSFWKQHPQKVKLLLLHKDARSYAASGKHWKKKESVEIRLQNWYRLHKNKYLPILNKMDGCDIMAVKYDHLAKEPDLVRRKLAGFIGASHTQSEKWSIEPKKMHLVAGNPMRFKEKIKISYDDRWKSELNPDELSLAENYEERMQDLLSSLPRKWIIDLGQ